MLFNLHFHFINPVESDIYKVPFNLRKSFVRKWETSEQKLIMEKIKNYISQKVTSFRNKLQFSVFNLKVFSKNKT
jgi:hypothetical protein